MSDSLLQLTDPSFFADGDPHALWRRLRADEPVAWTPEKDGPGFWSITRYDDGARVFRDSQTFSSAYGTTLEGDRWQPDPAAGKMLALTDHPAHTQMRQMLMPFFTARNVNKLESEIREYVHALVLHCSERGRFDFVEEIAGKLPVAVFFTTMGIPRSDWDSLFDIIIRTMSADEEDKYVADGEMLLYLSELVAARAKSPGNDLLGTIVTLRIDDRPLSSEEIILNLAGIVSASIDTVRLAIAGGLAVLIEHPDQWDALRDEPELLSPAVEEILRWTSPALALYRTATEDTKLHEQEIRRHDRVNVWIPSLNRDERVFVDADEFDVRRNPNRHLGFGVGEHACIGAVFARMQLRLLFQELVTRWRAISFTAQSHRLHSLVLHGIDLLPVQVELA